MPISINNTTLTFNNGTTMTTAATGTVSSVATGNGLQGGTITTTGTLSIAAPGFNTVGSYTSGRWNTGGSVTAVAGSNYSVGSGTSQWQSWPIYVYGDTSPNTGQLSGTWRNMSGSITSNGDSQPMILLACRVS